MAVTTTVSTAARQALANQFNQGSKRLNPRFLVYEDDAGVLYLLSDTAHETDESASPPEVVSDGTVLCPATIGTQFDNLYLIGNVGAYSIASVDDAVTLIAGVNAGTGVALSPYVISTTAFTAGDVIGPLTAGDRVRGKVTSQF